MLVFGAHCRLERPEGSIQQLQDPTGLLHLRMLFMDTPTQTALSLRPGYSIAVGGVAVPEQEAARGSPLQAEWVEVRLLLATPISQVEAGKAGCHDSVPASKSYLMNVNRPRASIAVVGMI